MILGLLVAVVVGLLGWEKKRGVSLFVVNLSSEIKRETEKRELKEYKKIIKK